MSIPATEENELLDPTGVVIEQETPASPPNTHMVDLVFTRLELVNYAMYTKIRELSPFGAANPEPGQHPGRKWRTPHLC